MLVSKRCWQQPKLSHGISAEQASHQDVGTALRLRFMYTMFGEAQVKQEIVVQLIVQLMKKHVCPYSCSQGGKRMVETTRRAICPTGPKTPERIPRIIQSTLLETATIYSIVLHHFSAWANYNERSFAENQKFIKDTKSDMRRRLCRRYAENITTKEKDASNDLQTEDGLIFRQSKGVFASDY